ncbi:MAG: chemotaxis protein CheW [Anaerolineae bacterium]|nr:chemotaxis protein CheW [Anaerolineae bacterium]
MSENFYAILEIEPGVEQEVIDSAYRRLALLYHPDLNHSPEATRRMQEVNVAYTTLRNPSKRALYDRSNGISTVIHSSGPTSFTNREAYRQQNVYNPPPRAATPPPPPPPVTNSAPPSETQLLTFYIENSAYAFNILDIESVNMMQPLMQHLRAPLFVEGLIAYRGGRIPVVDLRRHLGFPNQPATRETRILVVKFSSISTGLIVDSTGSPLRVENSSIESPQTASDGVRPSFVKGTVRSGYQVVVILDLAALFTLEEYRALKNFMAV